MAKRVQRAKKPKTSPQRLDMEAQPNTETDSDDPATYYKGDGGAMLRTIEGVITKISGVVDKRGMQVYEELRDTNANMKVMMERQNNHINDKTIHHRTPCREARNINVRFWAVLIVLVGGCCAIITNLLSYAMDKFKGLAEVINP